MAGVDPAREQSWRSYAASLLVFSLVSILVLYLQQRLQAALPLNPTGAPAVPGDLALNTAVSFNHQHQLAELLGRDRHGAPHPDRGPRRPELPLGRGRPGDRRRPHPRDHPPDLAHIGNFWADLTRSTMYVLLPIALVAAVVLVWQGAPQTFGVRHR